MYILEVEIEIKDLKLLLNKEKERTGRKNSRMNNKETKKFLKSIVNQLDEMINLKDFNLKAGNEFYKLTNYIESRMRAYGEDFQHILDMYPKMSVILRKKFKIIISIYQKREKKWNSIKNFTKEKKD